MSGQLSEPLSGDVRPSDTRSRNARSSVASLLASSAGRNLGLVLALLVLCAVGLATSGDRFASTDNLLTILRLSAVIGVVSVGMTFVIIGGGIDLSVGSIVALASVWCTTLATQNIAQDTTFLVMVGCALLVGMGCGLVNGVLIAYGGIIAFIATLAMFASARGLAEQISNRQSQVVRVSTFNDVFRGELLGLPVLVWLFAAVAAAGWVLLNRTTFGRRTFAIGGNAEAARLAGIDVRRRTTALYVLLGLCCGIAAIMITARITTGTASHGQLYELDGIAAIVIGGHPAQRPRPDAFARLQSCL